MLGKRFNDESVLIVGLGRFGGSLAESLEGFGQHVLAVDENEENVQAWAGKLTHVVQADATSEAAMRQVGAHEFKIAVVAIGSGIEASVLATSVLVDMGIQEVWSKAITHAHGRILERIGASHVVYPERDAGTRLARVLSAELVDYTEFEDGFAMAKVRTPKQLNGKTLQEVGIRENYDVNVVGIKAAGGAFSSQVTKDTTMRTGDLMVIAGSTKAVEAFSKLELG